MRRLSFVASSITSLASHLRPSRDAVRDPFLTSFTPLMSLLPALLDSVRPGRAHLLSPDPFDRFIPALTSALAFSPGPCATIPLVLEALDSSCPRCSSPFILSSPLPHSPMALSAFNALFHSYRVQTVASTTTSSSSPLGYRLTCPDPARLHFPSMPVVLDLPHQSLGTYPAYFLTPWGE